MGVDPQCRLTTRSRELKNLLTLDEERFIRNLGKHSTLKVPREKLLKGYLEGCRKREIWGELDKPSILDRVRVELDRIESGVGKVKSE